MVKLVGIDIYEVVKRTADKALVDALRETGGLNTSYVAGVESGINAALRILKATLKMSSEENMNLFDTKGEKVTGATLIGTIPTDKIILISSPLDILKSDEPNTEEPNTEEPTGEGQPWLN